MTRTSTDTQTLDYLRPARKAADGDDGLLYMHRWKTGCQELIFVDHEHAKRWAGKNTNTVVTGPREKAK